MATIRGRNTLNNVDILLVDVSPNLGAGTPAPVGSIATVPTGELWIKEDVLDTDWARFQQSSPSGTLDVQHGGTGLATINVGEILYGSALNVFSPLPVGTTSTVLQSIGGLPAYALIANANISPTAAIDRTKIANGMPNELIVNDGSGTLSSIPTLNIARGGTGLTAIGTANQVIGVNATGTANEYKTIQLGTSGTDFNLINTAGVITLNLPDASATARGVITTASQTIAGVKSFTSQLLLALGSVTTPALSFIGDPNTGLFSSSADNISLVTNGVSRLNAGSTGIITIPNLSTIGIVHNNASGILTTSLIVNTDVDPAAAIDYSKLNLTGSIVNNDVASAAAIARTKLASGTPNQVIINDGSGVLGSEASLSETRGGTHQTTYATGDILYASAPNVLTKLPAGTNFQLLQIVSGIPSWQTLVDAGITSLNGLTTISQTFATGTSGTDFNIVSSGAVHTFNIPDASLIARGVVTTGAQAFAGAKTFAVAPTVTTFTTAGLVHNNAAGLFSTSLLINADVAVGAAIDYNKLAALTINKALVSDSSGYISVSATSAAEVAFVAGLNAPVQAQLNNKQPLDSTLTSLAAYNTNGFLVQTAADTFVGRTITAGTGISVTNGDGNSANPIIASTISQYTDEQAQDAVGNILTDTATIDFTYNDPSNVITADIVALSITNAFISLTAAIARTKIANGTANQVVINDSSGTLTSEAQLAILRGGTGISTTPANGQLLIGNGTGYTLSSLTGTANQIVVTNGVGSITLSLPQNIATASSPTFTGLTLSGFTVGSVVFAGTAGLLTQDNANFFFDDSTNRLGLGTAVPTAKLDIRSSTASDVTLRVRGAGSQSVNFYSVEDSSGNLIESLDLNQVKRFGATGKGNPNLNIAKARAQTTNNTATTIYTFVTATDTAYLIKWRTITRRTDAGSQTAAYIRSIHVENIGGVMDIVTNQSDFTSEDLLSPLDVSVSISGTTILLKVIGENSRSYDWNSIIEWQEV